jgi:hypothetical protein
MSEFTEPNTAFWWTAGIFASGAVVAGALFRSGPLDRQGTPGTPVPGGIQRKEILREH